jgi:hypothetical protein
MRETLIFLGLALLLLQLVFPAEASAMEIIDDLVQEFNAFAGNIGPAARKTAIYIFCSLATMNLVLFYS